MTNNSYLYHRFFKIFCLLACGFILYSFVLGAPFKTLDDRASISHNVHVSDLKYVPEMFRTSFFSGDFYYRPLVSLTFALERHFFGLNYFFFNIINLLLHLATGLIVFFLISLLFKDETLGFWVAFLFIIHPVQAEAVANVAGRSILLCAFFELSAFLSFCLFMRRQKKRYLILSMLLFALALLSKESSASLPLIIFTYSLFFYCFGKGCFAKAIKKALPFFGVVAGYLILRLSLGISRVPYTMDIKDYGCGLLTFARSFLTYLRILFLPGDLHFDRIRPVIYNLLSVEAMVAIGAVILFIIFLIRFRKKISPEILFMFSFIALRLLPLCQVIPIRSQAQYICIPDHFLYVPSVGLWTLIVFGFRYAYLWLREKKQLTKTLAVIIVSGWIAFLALTTIEQNIYATNEMAMYARSLRFAPNHVRMNITLGLSYALDGAFKDAEKCFRKALDYEPFNVRARLGLGTAVLDQGRYWEGLEEYAKIADPGDFKELLDENKNLAYRILIEKYNKMLERQPTSAQVLYSLGVVYAKKGDFEKGILYFKQALQYDASLLNAKLNLCNCYLALGQDQEAKTCFATLKK